MLLSVLNNIEDNDDAVLCRAFLAKAAEALGDERDARRWIDQARSVVADMHEVTFGPILARLETTTMATTS